MPLITATDFHGRFHEGCSVIFVGNAPSLKGESLGEWIDSHAIIVRFNEARIEGFEDDVGTKTDILVTNPYVNYCEAVTISKHGVFLVISPQTRRQPSSLFESFLENHSVFFTYAPDIVQVGGIEHTKSLTTGVYGIHLLHRLLRPSRISLTGFTMFLNDTPYHYWKKNLIHKGLHAHDPEIEASIFISICNNMKCHLTISEDIAWVAREISRKLAANVHIKTLSSQKWKS